MKIEKNVPVPNVSTRENSLASTLKIMEVGDSVVFKKLKNPYVSAKAVNIKIAVRKISETEMRVWRIA